MNTNYNDNQEIDWDLARQNEKINGSKAKNSKRHDKYGNELLSDEAFNVGLEGGMSYLEYVSQYQDDISPLKNNRVFLSGLQASIENSITNNGFDPNSDLTYQDLNEIAGNLFGEEIDFEQLELGNTVFTGRKYMGYKPENTKKNEGEVMEEQNKTEAVMEVQSSDWFELDKPIRVEEDTSTDVAFGGLYVSHENVLLDKRHKNVLAVSIEHMIEFPLLKDELLATGNLTEERAKTIFTPRAKYNVALYNGYSEADAVKFSNSNYTDLRSYEEQTAEGKIANVMRNYSDFADESGRNAASDLSDEEFEFIKNHYAAGDMPDDVINKIFDEDNNYFKNKNIEAYKFTAYQTVLANLKEKQAMPEQAVVEEKKTQEKNKVEGWNTSLNLKVYQNKEDAVLVKLGEPGHETLKDVWLPKEQVLISNKTGNIVGMNNDLYAKYRDYILPTQFSKNKIEPLEIHHATEKAVLVKLAIAGEEKLKDTWWPKYRVDLDKDEKNVVAIDNYLQKQYGNVLSKQAEIKAAAVGKSVATKQPKLSPMEYAQKMNNMRLDDLAKNVPAEMKALPNWCVLKIYKDKATGSTKKFIVNANNPQGGWAKHNDPSNWTTFDKAMEYARKNNGAGLSFAIKGSGFNAFDLDHCYDKETKTYNETAKKFLADLPNSYAERSVSGTGLHIFTKGSVCENGKYNEARGGAAVEVFETWGFVSMTGNIVDEQHKNLVDLPDEVKKSIQTEIGEKKVYQAPTQNRNQFRNYARSDSEVIDVIRKSKRANEFESLMNGADLCGDHSRSDLRLMGILAYFTNSNTNQMETIFKQSKLYRPDKGDSYVERTAKFAANNASQQAH